MQAISDEEFQNIKTELHGNRGLNALHFAESAEQQHAAINDSSKAHRDIDTLESSTRALASRLAPGHGQPSSLQPPSSGPFAQVRTLTEQAEHAWTSSGLQCRALVYVTLLLAALCGAWMTGALGPSGQACCHLCNTCSAHSEPKLG